MYIYINICICTHKDTHKCIQSHIHKHAHKHIHKHTHTYVAQMHTQADTQTHTQEHTQTHTHICIYIFQNNVASKFDFITWRCDLFGMNMLTDFWWHEFAIFDVYWIWRQIPFQNSTTNSYTGVCHASSKSKFQTETLAQNTELSRQEWDKSGINDLRTVHYVLCKYGLFAPATFERKFIELKEWENLML